VFPLESAIAPLMKSAGFSKKGRTWWRAHAEAIDVLNLQKSEFGDQLYVNLAVYLRELGAEDRPPQHRCHLRARLERVADPRLFTDIRSAEAHAMPCAGLLEAIASDAMAWFASLSTLPSLRATVAASEGTQWFVHADVRKLLGMDQASRTEPGGGQET